MNRLLDHLDSSDMWVLNLIDNLTENDPGCRITPLDVLCHPRFQSYYRLSLKQSSILVYSPEEQKSKYQITPVNKT